MSTNPASIRRPYAAPRLMRVGAFPGITAMAGGPGFDVNDSPSYGGPGAGGPGGTS
jgi:hypothetical protein